MSKRPWVAALLNFLFMGAGTACVGRRVPMALAVTAGGLLARYAEIRIAPPTTGHTSTEWLCLVTGLAIIQIGTAIDGYREAKAVTASAG